MQVQTYKILVQISIPDIFKKNITSINSINHYILNEYFS